MPRYPAACQIDTPRCMSHVAAVCRSVCGTILPPSDDSPASCTAREKAVLTDANRLAVEFNEMASDQAKALPAPHVCQQARRYRRWWLTLVRGALSLGETIENPLVKIDKGATCSALR